MCTYLQTFLFSLGGNVVDRGMKSRDTKLKVNNLEIGKTKTEMSVRGRGITCANTYTCGIAKGKFH